MRVICASALVRAAQPAASAESDLQAQAPGSRCVAALDRGEALAGESGSGKSTIARLLARVCKPTAGTIVFQGEPLPRIRSRRDAMRYSGLVPMVFQDPRGDGQPPARAAGKTPFAADVAAAASQAVQVRSALTEGRSLGGSQHGSSGQRGASADRLPRCCAVP